MLEILQYFIFSLLSNLHFKIQRETNLYQKIKYTGIFVAI